MRFLAPRGDDMKVRIKDFERESHWAHIERLTGTTPDRSRLFGVCDPCYFRHSHRLPRLLNHTACNRRLDFRKADTD